MIGGQVDLRRVKVTFTDLSVLTFIRHFFSHGSRRERCSWIYLEESVGSGSVDNIAVSSAKQKSLVFGWVGMSAVYIR